MFHWLQHWSYNIGNAWFRNPNLVLYRPAGKLTAVIAAKIKYCCIGTPKLLDCQVLEVLGERGLIEKKVNSRLNKLAENSKHSVYFCYEIPITLLERFDKMVVICTAIYP